MKNVSRPFIFVLVTLLVLAIVGAALATGHFSADAGPHLVIFDDDLSDSALGWALAIPILVFVGVVIATVLAGAALVTVLAISLATVLVALALVLALTPIAAFFAIPALVVYGVIKLIQRDRRQISQAT